MDRHQKTPDNLLGRLQEKTGLFKEPLEMWQKKMDRSIDQYIRRDLDDAELLFVPDDLHTCDPSLMSEISSGHFGLDGMFVEVGEHKPLIFETGEADDSFHRVLHGFGWLRDLRAREDHESHLEAQRLVFEWIKCCSQQEGIAYEPEVIARRIMSFLSNSSFILMGVSKKKNWRFRRILSQQIAVLHYKLREVPNGLPRLGVLGALVMAGLCLSKHDKLLKEVTPLLLDELDQQILDDGGHWSRNPGALLEILFEIIPLKQCFKRRGQSIPKELDKTITRMIAMIRFFRMGDSSLGRFNGQSATPTNTLATLLVQEHSQTGMSPEFVPDSRYCRLHDGPMTVLCDVGSPPPVNIFARAHAGCLSFEMSIRHFAFVVNSGAFMGDDEKWQSYARSTRAHSTLTIDNHSSGGFLENGHLLGPDQVMVEETKPLFFKACHGGYEELFGLRHHRTCRISYKGLRLEGTDCLKGQCRPGKDVLFHIRFHLHPFIKLAKSDEDNLLLTLPDGEIWRFTAKGAGINMDDSIYLAYRRGPEAAHQIVLVGAARPDTKVSWVFEQYRPRPDVSRAVC
jgi:uncharacterized heparinase superfamily protein